MGIRIGVDIGIASVGWAVVDDEYRVLESGSNLFDSADASRNVDRRGFRQIKRLHRRRKNRVHDYNSLWCAYGNKIPDENIVDVLDARIKGLSSELSLLELYCVLRSALLHRGISYMDDALDDASSGKSDYQKGIQINQEKLGQDLFPCQIQKERLEKYGSYRGTITVTENNEKVTLSNIFTTSAYVKEVKSILENQMAYHSFIDSDFVDSYVQILMRKRKYYEGPGNEFSRTDYGIYTTKKDETGQYITEKNIFEKLIGRCSVYPEEIRAAGASYTAQEFNLLNDLNNLVVNERKLTEEERRKIVDVIKNSNSVNMRKIIAKVIGEDIETMSGARIDKNDKEIFHTFEQYRAMKKEFAVNGWNIDDFTRDEQDEIAYILTLNTEKEGIMEAFNTAKINLLPEQKELLVQFRKKRGSFYSKWQSFSLKIMKEIIPDMYITGKNQMQILTDMGVFKTSKEKFVNTNKIPVDTLLENIYNPVVCRSIRITVNVLNALIKKYGYPDQIVVEMPRDKNSDEEKARIKDMQKKNEKELAGIIKKIRAEHGITIKDEDFHHHKNLALKLKLWNEQKGKCIYSGRPIEIEQLLKDQWAFEIDHIIPKSISFDDSRMNKVLVYEGENRDKGNKTPFMYLSKLKREWDFEMFKNFVGSMEIPSGKKQKLLFMQDITKVEVLQGFIARNINDTRYASRVVLNALQDYFMAKETNTKVRVIRGSFTSQLRKVLQLEKDREESFSHHAVDAMIMCYSQMGFDVYHKMQMEIVDEETGEIFKVGEFDRVMSNKVYNEMMYQNKLITIRKNIAAAKEKTKYWHKVDKKANRSLGNQTIRGTRNKNGKVIKINKLDLYDISDVKRFKEKIKKGKESSFLMFEKDPKTWEQLMLLMSDYADSPNPLQDYLEETGDYFRKYAKKHNGPKIQCIKYYDGEVKSCLDISHKYGFSKGSKKVILEGINPFRMDVYCNEKKKEYILVGVKYADLKYTQGRYVIDEDAYTQILRNEKMIQNDQVYTDVEENGYEFQMSFYKNEIIQYEKDGEFFTERFSSRTMPNKKNYIETKPVDRPKFGEKKQNLVGLSKTNLIEKIRTDILGNRYKANKEKFSLWVDLY